MLRTAITFAIPLALAAAPARAQDRADAQLTNLVQDFAAAEHDFDQKRLAALITDDYAEVSPLGELDLHDAFLGFYAADKKQPAPAMTIGETLVRRYGDAASILTSLSFARPGPDGQPRTVSIRAGFLAVKVGGTWKLASAQYTPERPKVAAK
ncbi:nuclear transport factor 2 family protein [Sphingomonas sp. HF-S4]|uniref:Nuclear transport factor 2 family protein n=1 Tax=Sphingomonas agrestis TaxID=3080540 RepID=A0ABU3Y879_9SPHN|nr:nuclear transport factor 2 family protein [Sphingomonas sp. HF-S4]MDV3457517.1 nuclear transport factor 2 family protein [Sphingomonas sp. HF-S4]